MAYPQQFYPNFYQQPQMAPQSQQQRSNDFILVPNEQTARNYPVAPGNSVNFKDENAAYIYTKTMGFSQFDQPIFKKYKLIEEETRNLPEKAIETNEAINVSINDLKSKIEALESEIETLNDEIKNLKEQAKKPVGKKKEVVDDD